jgi:hypothetical protein
MKNGVLFFRIPLLLLSGLAHSAHAAHPFVTDDTTTQGRRNSQIELNADRFRFGGETGRVAALTYSYGAADALDLYGNLPMSLSAPSGKGDLSLGAKWRYWQSARSSLAIKPELLLPTGDEAKGLGNGRAGLALTLLAATTHGRWGIDGNLGLTANRYKLPEYGDSRHRLLWRASAAVSYSISPQWLVAADIGVARNIEKSAGTNPAFILVGAIYSPRPNLDIDLGIKAGLNAAEVSRQAGAGLTMRF